MWGLSSLCYNSFESASHTPGTGGQRRILVCRRGFIYFRGSLEAQGISEYLKGVYVQDRLTLMLQVSKVVLHIAKAIEG